MTCDGCLICLKEKNDLIPKILYRFAMPPKERMSPSPNMLRLEAREVHNRLSLDKPGAATFSDLVIDNYDRCLCILLGSRGSHLPNIVKNERIYLWIRGTIMHLQCFDTDMR